MTTGTSSTGGKEVIQYMDSLTNFLEKVNISREDICLVGSAVLSDHGLRKNSDLDIAVDPFKRGDITSESRPDEIEISVEKYSRLGVNDWDLIHTQEYHYRSNGFKIVKPEIELSFKHRRLWEKDKKDIDLLENRFLDTNDYDWDWDLFSYEFYPEIIGYRGLPDRSKKDTSLVAKFERRARKDGIRTALLSALQFAGGSLPVARQLLPSPDEESLHSTTTDDTLYFIVWPTVSKFFDVMPRHLDNELGVIDTEYIDLDCNMEQFIHDVYDFDDRGRLIEYKTHKITNDGSTVLLIETESPITSSGDLDERFVSNLKDRVRKEFYPYVDQDEFHNIIHGPDSVSENNWIKDIIHNLPENE